MIDLETPHTIETETIQTTRTDKIKKTDHKSIQTIDQFLKIVTIYHVTLLKIKFQIIQIDEEIFLNHRTESIHKIRVHNESIEVVHLNINDKLNKYNQLKKLNMTLPVLRTQKPQNYTNQLTCESTTDESETEITLLTKMLQIKNEYEIPIESNYYQNNSNNLRNPDKI